MKNDAYFRNGQWNYPLKTFQSLGITSREIVAQLIYHFDLTTNWDTLLQKTSDTFINLEWFRSKFEWGSRYVSLMIPKQLDTTTAIRYQFWNRNLGNFNVNDTMALLVHCMNFKKIQTCSST